MKISWRESGAKANPSVVAGHAELEKKSNCSVFQKFLNENLFARWRDNYWSAMPTDLIIEQVLTRSLKSNGVLNSWKRNGWVTNNKMVPDIALLYQDYYRDGKVE